MKSVELSYLPGDTCWVRGQYRVCIIESITIEESGVTYNWYDLDCGADVTEVGDDGYFTSEDIGKTVFDSLEELEKAFPEDFDSGEDCE